jgi:AraC-like DNA-binding protein
VAWQTRSGDVLLDANHALLFPQGAAALTALDAPASLTILCEPRIDFGLAPSVRLIDSSAFLEQFYLTLTPLGAHHLERLARLVWTLRSRTIEKPDSSSARSPSYGRIMQQYMNDALAQPFKLEAIARAAGLSAPAASRIFHREAGLPPRVYVRRLRLRSALARMAEEYDLSQVALDLGFFDHAHFTRAFHNEFGITPSHWRDFAISALGQARTRRTSANATTIPA